MPLYEFLRLAIEKLESSQQKPCPVDPCLEGENESVDTVTRSPATLGSSVSARLEKCGGVEYIFNEISPSDLGPKDPWLSYGTSSDHLDNSFRPLSDPSILSGGLTNDNAIAMPAAQPKELLLHGMAKNVSLDTFMNKDKCLLQNNAAYSVRAVDGDRATTCSVSSGNSGDDRASYEEKHAKNNEELECQSDELQNASVGVKKSSAAEGGRRSKRRRAAEVHNLSERRRRDRINQKMQALQQLIPNCNKADKASMLDEAIEYLKNLKHQVQMMSMGCGSCVMYPGPGHMYDAGMPHFSYMGMGMGMRMGGSRSFGYTNPPRCPVFPTSPMGFVNLQAAPGMCGHPGSVVYRTVPVGWHHTTFNNNSQPSRSSPAHQN